MSCFGGPVCFTFECYTPCYLKNMFWSVPLVLWTLKWTYWAKTYSVRGFSFDLWMKWVHWYVFLFSFGFLSFSVPFSSSPPTSVERMGCPYGGNSEAAERNFFCCTATSCGLKIYCIPNITISFWLRWEIYINAYSFYLLLKWKQIHFQTM